MSAVIDGSWTGNAGSSVRAPHLSVFVDDSMLGPPDAREVASVDVAKPFFAADVKLGELCSDEGSTATRIDVRCIVGAGQIAHIVVRAAGNTIDASVDGAPPRPWHMTYGEPAVTEHACYVLHGFRSHRDLEPARAAWGRDAASAKCEGKPRSVPVHVAVEFPAVGKSGFCMGTSGPRNTTGMSMTISESGKMDLGELSNQCGGLHVTRYDDAEALLVETSDMGTEERFAYRLGDRLYFTRDDGAAIESTDLPCGARAVFDVHYPWTQGLVEARGRLNQR